MKKISFVIACYNSSKSLELVVDEVKSTIAMRSEYDYEIILVNDYSRDETYKKIQEICSKDKKIKGINFARNFGQQPAMLAGFKYATGELVAYCDDDGQSPVDEIFKLVDKLDEGYDMVWANFAHKNNSILKNLSSSLNDMMVNYLFNKPKDLYFGNLWIAKRFVTDEAINCKNPFPYLGGVFLKTTTNMANVLTSHRKRLHGSSNYSFFKLLSLWLNGFTAFSVVPLRAASIVGFTCSFLGFIFMIYLIIEKILNPAIPMGYSSLMSVVLFTGGMIMLMLGLLGEYIGRIYININNVPQYVINDSVNLD